MNPGSSYGLGGHGRMRMNIATSRKLLELALNNLATALRKSLTGKFTRVTSSKFRGSEVRRFSPRPLRRQKRSEFCNLGTWNP